MLLLIVLPDHFWDGFGGAVFGALLGAIVGGALAIVGGAISNHQQAKQAAASESERARHELAAALRIVRYELITNVTSIQTFLEHHMKYLPVPLTDSAYREVALTLARHYNSDYLTPEDRARLVDAYTQLPFVEAEVRGRGEGKEIPPEMVKSLQGTYTKLDSLQGRLAEVLEANLHVPPT